jgi:hypothetical protein
MGTILHKYRPGAPALLLLLRFYMIQTFHMSSYRIPRRLAPVLTTLLWSKKMKIKIIQVKTLTHSTPGELI